MTINDFVIAVVLAVIYLILATAFYGTLVFFVDSI